ncbi:carbonic anhydrase 9 isoform X2 [Zootoca vivipara]|uniref:carbonic anhydrase 9 isoform X2 n=1 Tax=Zootoca vivipara TaxID=8524 RepID=UPI00293BB288|nr:carbonic anhydrase 9 isoform X2 [Zootoca vivipara]
MSSRDWRGLPRGRLLLLAALLAWAAADAHEEEADGPHSEAGPPPGHGNSHWSYADKAEWASDFPHCGGHMQSPINIETRAALFSPQLEPILLPDYSLPPREMLRLQNNGHTVVLEMPRNLTVTGGGFPQPYQAAQLHLHWGSDLKPGSEHTVDGHRYAGEIHVVYYSSRFDTIQEAQVEPGGLAVLAAFLQVGSEENKPYQHILEHLNEVHEEGEETWIPAFDVAKLLPDDLSRYFRYNGSLTTPPCYQTVNWTIFNQTIRLSPDQISVLEDTLHADEDELIQDNFRLPQSLQGRRVLASFPMLHSPERAQPPGEGASTRVPDPYGPAEEGGGNSAGSAAGGGQPLTPDGASGRDSEPASGEGQTPATSAGADQQVGSSLQTGDVLAAVFAALFGITALAFFLYVRKQQAQKRRRDCQPTKSSIIYTAATTEENAA